MTSFKDITGPLSDQKDNFFDATGFYEVCGAEVKTAFIGMFVSLYAQVNGEINSLKTQWGATCPYMELNTAGLESSSNQMYEGFVNYIKALNEVITAQIPDVLEKAENLPQEAEEAKEAAMGELEQLDFM